MKKSIEQNTPVDKNAKLQAAQQELAQATQSLESDFAKAAAEYVENDPELEDLFFENRQDFFKKICEFQNKFLRDGVLKKSEDVKNLEGEIAFDSKMQDLAAAEAAFREQNPNVDTKELLAFYAQLPQEIQEELENLPADQVFPTLLALKEQNSTENALADSAEQAQNAPSEVAQSPSDDLPAQVSGIPAQASSHAVEKELPTQRM